MAPLIALLLAIAGCGTRDTLPVATTTSVEASGVLPRLVAGYEKASGTHLRVVVVGSGQALALLERGDVEAALTHDPDGEQALVARGIAKRLPIMRNDFVLVGPPADPAGAKGKSVEAALRAIAEGGHRFLSRGDDSGTHRREKKLWQAIGVVPAPPAYREVGQGMGETLTMASEMGAYTLVDTATLATFRSRIRLTTLVAGDPRLANPYAALWRTRGGGRFAEWLRSAEARAIVRPLFTPL